MEKIKNEIWKIKKKKYKGQLVSVKYCYGKFGILIRVRIRIRAEVKCWISICIDL